MWCSVVQSSVVYCTAVTFQGQHLRVGFEGSGLPFEVGFGWELGFRFRHSKNEPVLQIGQIVVIGDRWRDLEFRGLGEMQKTCGSTQTTPRCCLANVRDTKSTTTSNMVV